MAFEAASAGFLTWLASSGASVSEKIELADLRARNAGRGVIAKQSLGEDEELFRIPRATVLTVETSSLPGAIKAELSTDEPWLALIIAMVFESQQGDSKWQPYIDLWPQAFDTLMYWGEDELKLLQGSAVLDKIGKESADVMFAEKILPLLRAHAGAFKIGSMREEEMLALCHRMGSTIMAYAFDLEGAETEEDGWEESSDSGETLPKGMVPLADMLNADAERNNAKLFYEDDFVVMKTISAVAAGEELFNDYGALPSADVLRRYGYVTEGYGKYDVVELTMDLLRKIAGVTEDRFEYLDAAGVADDGYDVGGDDEEALPEELLSFANGVTMPQDEFSKLVTKQKVPKPVLTQESAEFLYNALVARRSEYPDDVVMADGRRAEMARMVVEGEKKVLHRLAQHLKRHMSKKRKADDSFEEEAARKRVS